VDRPQIGTITTRSIDAASYVMATTDIDCSVIFAGSLASFSFPSDFATRDALVSYECGGQVEGKQLLAIRNQLFRRIKGGRA
jgi:hypothetical protein